jgi:hypothetical protein
MKRLDVEVVPRMHEYFICFTLSLSYLCQRQEPSGSFGLKIQMAEGGRIKSGHYK